MSKFKHGKTAMVEPSCLAVEMTNMSPAGPKLARYNIPDFWYLHSDQSSRPHESALDTHFDHLMSFMQEIGGGAYFSQKNISEAWEIAFEKLCIQRHKEAITHAAAV